MAPDNRNIAYHVQPFDSIEENLRPTSHRRRFRPWPFAHHSADFQSLHSINHSTPAQLQEASPTFIPKFAELRRTCIQHTEAKLRALERNIAALPDPSPERSQALDEAAQVLGQLDAETMSEVKRQQMEDPEYAEARGISLVHFAVGPGASHAGQWMMLSSPWGKKSRSILEADTSRLSELHQARLEEFAGGSANLEKVYFKRAKSAAESQPGAVILDRHGIIALRPSIVLMWRFLIGLAALCLVCFFGVGIIATNTTFAPLYRKYFFWISILWTLSSSALLSWLVHALGGNKKDAMSSFLAGIGIWLVVIQIGQTHLEIQTGSGS